MLCKTMVVEVQCFAALRLWYHSNSVQECPGL